MMLLPCPYCGPRDVTEFTYGGDGDMARPSDPQAASDAQWASYVYIRDNPRGPHDELWQHSAGCRRWIRVRRDTLTHEVLLTAPAGRPVQP
ncbi:MAG: sarcosine oxidase subunit delta [Betaproteobacteria bacterium RIFCSPLOWO2_12_FULL_62_58]|nr:MAG: sarcosine oxidase subunit delta [Betaproteobacteria bacterium RIFCSPLOWO2_12_FULL_62_58]